MSKKRSRIDTTYITNIMEVPVEEKAFEDELSVT